MRTIGLVIKKGGKKPTAKPEEEAKKPEEEAE